MRVTWMLLLTITAILLVRTRTQSQLLRWLDKQYDLMRRGFARGVLQTGSASRRGIAISGAANTIQQKGNSLRVTSQRFNSKFQEPVPEDIPFPCGPAHGSPGTRSATRPTSVHRLRPGDIDVIGAMGDSLTAGSASAAANLVEVFIENRGMSWSIGGESTWREYLTLPNILKNFNPNLIGYSVSDSLGSQKDSQFNVAEPLSISSDMSFQAKLLVKRMRSDERVDYENDWKAGHSQ